MFKSLSLLTDSDWHTLRASAQELRFQNNQVIITAGSDQDTIYLILSGYVRITGEVDGHSITLHRLGPDETFGEMSFLEEQGASASVVAEGEVVVEAIESNKLKSLLSSDPGFSARLFHSLAVTLSQRLRDATVHVQELNVNEVAQVNRFHSTRLGYITERQLPEGLMQAMEHFDSTLRSLQGRLRKGERISDLDRQVEDLCDSVIDNLKRFTGPEALIEIGYDDLMGYRDTDQLLIGIGAYVFRETFRWIMLSETMAHCYMKPRGFSDDIATNTMIYANRPAGDTQLGESIDRWFLGRPFCSARRESRGLMANMMEGLVQNKNRPSILGLATGSSQEVIDFLQKTKTSPVITLVDVDQDALASVAEAKSRQEIAHSIDFVEQNVLGLMAGRGRMTLELQDLIIVPGLMDYLQDSECIALLEWLHGMLDVGGAVILSITAPNHVDSPLLFHLLEWLMHERTPEEFMALVSRTPFESSSPEWFSDGDEVVKYLTLKKS